MGSETADQQQDDRPAPPPSEPLPEAHEAGSGGAVTPPAAPDAGPEHPTNTPVDQPSDAAVVPDTAHEPVVEAELMPVPLPLPLDPTLLIKPANAWQRTLTWLSGPAFATTTWRPPRRAPAMAMIVLIFVSFGLRVLWLDQPDKSLIFDEKYYVSAALTILDMPQPADAPYAHSTPGKDGNPEHPALAKLIMAAGIALDGDNPWGWRFPSVLAGTLSIVFVYKVARAVGLSAWPAVLAAYLYSFDNLVFITSRIGILDIYMMLGLLAGAALFLMNRPVWAGVLFAFGTLCKEGGVYGPAIVGIFAVLVTLVRWAGWHVAFRRALFTTVMAVVFVAVTLGGLWQIDLRWSTFTNPIDHVTHIWDYGTHLTKAAGPSGIESYPWEWLLNEVQIPYLKVTVTICGKAIPNNGPCLPTDVLRQYDSILFRGAMNPFLLFVLPLAGAFAIAQLRAKRSATALFSLVWFGLAYLPYIPLSVLDHRIEYFYYIFTAIPAIAIATAALFSDPRIPKSVTVGFVIGILYGFAGYFPFSGFKV